MTGYDLAGCQVVFSPISSSRGKYDIAGDLFFFFFHGIMFCYVQSCLLFALHYGQKVISVIFDNHRVHRLVPVVLEPRYRLALNSPGEMHYNHRAPRLVPVVLEPRYRLALETHQVKCTTICFDTNRVSTIHQWSLNCVIVWLWTPLDRYNDLKHHKCVAKLVKS